MNLLFCCHHLSTISTVTQSPLTSLPHSFVRIRAALLFVLHSGKINHESFKMSFTFQISDTPICFSLFVRNIAQINDYHVELFCKICGSGKITQPQAGRNVLTCSNDGKPVFWLTDSKSFRGTHWQAQSSSLYPPPPLFFGQRHKCVILLFSLSDFQLLLSSPGVSPLCLALELNAVSRFSSTQSLSVGSQREKKSPLCLKDYNTKPAGIWI